MEKKALAAIHLREANEHIRRAEVCIQLQEGILKHLEQSSADMTDALQLLVLFNSVMKTMYEHRNIILSELNE